MPDNEHPTDAETERVLRHLAREADRTGYIHYTRNQTLMPTTSPTTSPATTEAAAVADIVQRSSNEAPITRDHENTTLLIWPKNQRIESLERFDAFPRRKRAVVCLTDPESFCAYVKAHATVRTIILGIATEIGGSFRAIFDYHRPETQYEDAEKAAAQSSGDTGCLNDAGWGEHNAVYELVNSPEWKRWLAWNASDVPQKEFAEFLEDNSADIIVPSTAGAGYPNAEQMIQVSLYLEAKSQVSFSSGIRLQNGQTQLTYVEKIDATTGADGKMAIPERFALGLSPFRGSDRYEVRARLKYRISPAGRLGLRYELERTHKVVELAFAGLRAKIEAGTGLPVLQGSVDLSRVGG